MTRPLTHSPTHLPTHTLTHPHTHSPTHSLTSLTGRLKALIERAVASSGGPVVAVSTPLNLNGFKELYLTNGSSQGLDCLLCATFARQREGVRVPPSIPWRHGRKTRSVPARAPPSLHPPLYPKRGETELPMGASIDRTWQTHDSHGHKTVSPTPLWGAVNGRARPCAVPLLWTDSKQKGDDFVGELTF